MPLLDLTDHVIDGEFASTDAENGSLVLRLLGRAEPLVVNFRGTLHSEMCAVKFAFKNANSATPCQRLFIDETTIFRVGEMRAMKMIDIPTVPKGRWNDYIGRGEIVPAKPCPAICFELFTSDNRFIRILSTEFEISSTKKTSDLEVNALQQNKKAFKAALDNLRSHFDTYLGRDVPLAPPQIRDEFEWEIQLQKEDRLIEVSRLVRTKYLGLEDYNKIETFLMRWNNLDENVPTDEEAFAADNLVIEYDWSVASQSLDPSQSSSREIAVVAAEKIDLNNASANEEAFFDSVVNIADHLDRAFPSLKRPMSIGQTLAHVKRAVIACEEAINTAGLLDMEEVLWLEKIPPQILTLQSDLQRAMRDIRSKTSALPSPPSLKKSPII